MNPLPNPQFAHDYDAYVLQNSNYIQSIQPIPMKPIKKAFKLANKKTNDVEKAKKDLKKVKEERINPYL